MEPITLVCAAIAAASGLVGIWQRAKALEAADGRAETRLAVERGRIDHLLGLLARKEAPAEQAWYMSDQSPDEPLVPANAVWDESGMFFTEPEDDE